MESHKVKVPYARDTISSPTFSEGLLRSSHNSYVLRVMPALPANLPQPDFDVVSRCFQTASTELAKCPNLPSLQQGDAILHTLQNIQGQLNTMNTRLNGIDRRLDGIDRRLDGMDRRFDGIDERFNHLEARIQAR